MLRIAICDDDLWIHEGLHQMLLGYSIKAGQDFEIQDFMTAGELLEAPFNYDILFLDVMLDKQNDGIEVGVALREKNNRALYIIMTSRGDRCADGYEATTFRFLVKPLTQEIINKTLKAAEMYMSLNSEEHFKVFYRGQVSFTLIKDIIMIESYQRQRIIITKYKDFPTTETWELLLGRLKRYEHFFTRIGKSFYVSMDKIQSSSTSAVTLTNGRVIILNKHSHEKFVSDFVAFLRAKGE